MRTGIVFIIGMMLISSHLVADEPVIVLETDRAIVHTKPGERTILFSFALVPTGYTARTDRRLDILFDDDGDGVAELRLDRPMERRSIWIAVDPNKGDFSVATPAGYSATRRELLKGIRGAQGTASGSLVVEAPFIEAIYVHPGHGIWSWKTFDGSPNDHDQIPNGQILLSLDDAQPVIAGGVKLKDLVPGGVLLLVDPHDMELFTLKLTGRDLQAGDAR